MSIAFPPEIDGKIDFLTIQPPGRSLAFVGVFTDDVVDFITPEVEPITKRANVDGVNLGCQPLKLQSNFINCAHVPNPPRLPKHLGRAISTAIAAPVEERSASLQVLGLAEGEGAMVLRATLDEETAGNVRPPAPGLIATRLLEALSKSEVPIVYVALSERSAAEISKSIGWLGRDVNAIVLPPWDCLPYDRVPPSKQCMGRRMDALRDWLQNENQPRIFVTSLDACLQRLPPSSAILASQHAISVGTTFDRQAFDQFVLWTGYSENGLVDEPGEYAFRDGVIEIFPAGAIAPMRVMLSEDGKVTELRSYDPVTQRTTKTVQSMVFGPASELVGSETEEPVDEVLLAKPLYRRLLQRYPEMQTVFDSLGRARVCFADGISSRLEDYLDIVQEARDVSQGDTAETAGRSLYLDRTEFEKAWSGTARFNLAHETSSELPWMGSTQNPSEAVVEFASTHHASGRTFVIAGKGEAAERLRRRIERRLGSSFGGADGWCDIKAAEMGSLLSLDCALEHSFLAQPEEVAVISVAEVMGTAEAATDAGILLAEPELKLGDVVVHEDHGVGVLSALETIEVDGSERDAARLEYRDGASVLVPMAEFDKLWRYGSEPTAVALDRLHTDAWEKKKTVIQKQVRGVARHLLERARERADTVAEKFVPPVAKLWKFAALFPYSETPDQQAAIKVVLSDLASGKPMNRLICGDVGYGKTEVALRSAAAVALCGGQVALVCPTTVLARQHYTTFKRRFAATGVEVAMLSRVATATEIKRVKEGLSSGKIGIVIATQAVLAKDVAFSRLNLLIVDEEHRFGKRDKDSMTGLSPALHRLSMSATPIPQTLQAAMIGVQEVSILATSPFRRRPVRTSLREFDKPTMQIGLSREHRRGGQSFVVVPQIEDIEPLKKLLSEIVPDLSIRVAHGKLPPLEMDDIMVRFAAGDGDILLATNIIESGLDVPNANTIFVWRPDRFGLAQLHQLRGRVGRGKVQGVAYLFTSQNDEISEDTKLRLSAMVEHDRLGAGLALSLQDLELRGGGDLIGEDQAGHLKVLGISLYQKLLERSATAAGKSFESDAVLPSINVGVTGGIPVDYIPDAAVRLNVNARLLRAGALREIDALREEFEDRFGELPEQVLMLLRLAKLKILSAQNGISRLDGGPKGIALELKRKPSATAVARLSRLHKPIKRDGRLLFELAIEEANDRVAFLEDLLGEGS